MILLTWKQWQKYMTLNRLCKDFFGILVKANLLEAQQTVALGFSLEKYCEAPIGKPQYLPIYFDMSLTEFSSLQLTDEFVISFSDSLLIKQEKSPQHTLKFLYMDQRLEIRKPLS